MFGSARGGWITDDVDVALKIANGEGLDEAMSMKGLLDAILEDIPAPAVHWYGEGESENESKEESDFETEPFSMAATTVGYDPYLGRTCTGRIYSGKIRSGDSITLLQRIDDSADETANSNNIGPSTQVSGVFANRGVSRIPLDPAISYAGDIVTLSGVPESLKVGDTLTSTKNMVPEAVNTPPLSPPTLSVS